MFELNQRLGGEAQWCEVLVRWRGGYLIAQRAGMTISNDDLLCNSKLRLRDKQYRWRSSILSPRVNRTSDIFHMCNVF